MIPAASLLLLAALVALACVLVVDAIGRAT